jgi:hypothetical protein
MGAAIATTGSLFAQNLFYQIGLKVQTNVSFFQWRYLRVYLTIILGATGVVLFQVFFNPPVYIDFGLAALTSLLILRINHQALNVKETFPEVLRFPLVHWFLGKEK